MRESGGERERVNWIVMRLLINYSYRAVMEESLFLARASATGGLCSCVFVLLVCVCVESRVPLGGCVPSVLCFVCVCVCVCVCVMDCVPAVLCSICGVKLGTRTMILVREQHMNKHVLFTYTFECVCVCVCLRACI